MKAPKSVTNIWFSMTGLLGYFLAIYGLRSFPMELSNFQMTLTIVLASALPMIFCEVFLSKCYRNASTGLNFSIKRDPDLLRVATKIFGLYCVLGFLALIYFMFPEYRGDFYDPYYQLCRLCVPLIMVFAIPYFLVMDRYLLDPQDSYWKFGMAVMRKRQFSKETLQLLLGWMVKGFFLPLMFIYLGKNVDFLLHFSMSETIANFSNLYEFLFKFLFSIDLLLVTIGYLCTFRLLDSHIRSTEPSFLGWGVALVCYQPFWSFFSKNYLSYTTNKQWGHWLGGSSFYTLWGVFIIALIGIYVWATLAFGVRFSNLTNRGIITNGPYRFTKHPAYLSKNLAWWFISMPFMISSSFQDSFRQSALLLALNLVYFMRAKTEERHLGMDPAYQAYALYIREHGMFSFLHRNNSVKQTSYVSPLGKKAEAN